MSPDNVNLHVIGLFHTIVNQEHSHCAFTGKVLRFSRMMKQFDYNLIEYSNGKTESECDIHVNILSSTKLASLKDECKEQKDFHGDFAIYGSNLWTKFNKKLLSVIPKYVKDGDIICYPFGNCHPDLLLMFPNCYHIETGIGYPECFLNFRIYESNAWMHWHYGKERVNDGHNYHWVAPNYYDLRDWTLNSQSTPAVDSAESSYILYFGRITPKKGLATIVEIAKAIKNGSTAPQVPKKIIICGQGNQEYIDKLTTENDNIIYKGAITGRERSELLGNAYCLLMPTVFIEPFGGAGIEGMLCGTPLLASTYGAFSETIVDGENGFKCNTLGDWILGLNSVPTLSRKKLGERARHKYCLETVGKKYDTIFKEIKDLAGEGWMSAHSHKQWNL